MEGIAVLILRTMFTPALSIETSIIAIKSGIHLDTGSPGDANAFHCSLVNSKMPSPSPLNVFTIFCTSEKMLYPKFDVLNMKNLNNLILAPSQENKHSSKVSSVHEQICSSWLGNRKLPDDDKSPTLHGFGDFVLMWPRFEHHPVFTPLIWPSDRQRDNVPHSFCPHFSRSNCRITSPFSNILFAFSHTSCSLIYSMYWRRILPSGWRHAEDEG